MDSSLDGFVIEATGDPEKLDECIAVLQSYGDIEVTRSGAIAVSLEMRKLRLQPPVPVAAAPHDQIEEEETDGVLHG